jgi:hypothetical protein
MNVDIYEGEYLMVSDLSSSIASSVFLVSVSDKVFSESSYSFS